MPRRPLLLALAVPLLLGALGACASEDEESDGSDGGGSDGGEPGSEAFLEALEATLAEGTGRYTFTFELEGMGDVLSTTVQVCEIDAEAQLRSGTMTTDNVLGDSLAHELVIDV